MIKIDIYFQFELLKIQFSELNSSTNKKQSLDINKLQYKKIHDYS